MPTPTVNLYTPQSMHEVEHVVPQLSMHCCITGPGLTERYHHLVRDITSEPRDENTNILGSHHIGQGHCHYHGSAYRSQRRGMRTTGKHTLIVDVSTYRLTLPQLPQSLEDHELIGMSQPDGAAGSIAFSIHLFKLTRLNSEIKYVLTFEKSAGHQSGEDFSSD